jgi:DNA-binding NtrC family response regulator
MADNTNKKKEDAKRISAREEYELNYLKQAYGVPKKVTAEIIKQVGTSRTKVYEELRKRNYPVPPKRKNRS